MSSPITGRLGVVRLVHGRSDMTFIVAYFPTRSEKGYSSLVSEMCKWIDGVFKDTPKRSTPFVGGDINDGIGFQRVQGCL